MIIRLNPPLEPTVISVLMPGCQRVPAPVSKTELEFAPEFKPITPFPAANTLAPLLTTSWFPLPLKPINRSLRLLQDAPVPVMMARLLALGALAPMRPLELLREPPLVTTRRLLLPFCPMYKSKRLLQAEVPSLTIIVFSAPPELPPSRP